MRGWRIAAATLEAAAAAAAAPRVPLRVRPRARWPPARPIRTRSAAPPPAPPAPLAALSVRSLLDYCAGGYVAPVATLTELPRARAALVPLLATLAARGIAPADFVRWHNILAARSWADAAALLAPVPPGTLPQLVVQRVLRKVHTPADVGGAIALVRAHLATYTLDQADRLVLFLAQHALQAGGWHAARTLTDMALDIAARWRARDPAHARAPRLLAALAGALLPAGDDARARAALMRLVDAGGAAVAARVAAAPPHRLLALVDVPLAQRLLEVCGGHDRAALLSLGVRAAAARGDSMAAEWAAELGRAAGAHHGTLPALVRAAFRVPGGAPAAWALFDAAVGADAAHDDPRKWALVLRAAAASASVAPARAAALLRLHEGDAAACDAHLARWHVPHTIAARLCAAVPAYTALMDGFAARGERMRAFAVYDVMCRRGVVPDARAYASLCRLYVAEGRIGEVVAAAGLYARASPAEPMHGCEQAAQAPRPPRQRQPALPPPCALIIPPSLPPVPPGHMSTHLLNTLLEVLLHTRPHEVRALYEKADDLMVTTDVVSLDLLVRAAAACADGASSPARADARAVRTHFRAVLDTQHPEIAQCRSALGGAWLLRGELRLQRLEGRLHALFVRAPRPVRVAPPHVRFDGRLFLHYAELLRALATARTPDAGAWEELFAVPVWLAALDISPPRELLALVLAAVDEALPPGVAESAGSALRRWLHTWTAVPSDAEVGAYVRARAMRRSRA